ncbi:MAG TPA: S41 family peptidase [Mucilaginibacter sp.]|jgi:C-terminal processing protease CtpA/Prc|nr:S41 family peptidase [Mucilaginibacter sp.]
MKIFLRSFALLLLFVIPAKMQAQSMRDTVSREDKLYALSLIWKEADYNFVFFDRQPHLNWDSLYKAYIPKILATKNVYEYFKVLKNFISTLKDGHTGMFYNQFYWNEIDSPPVRFVNKQGKRYVIAVDEPLKDQVPVGSEIIRLNGKSWEDYFNGQDLENNDWYGFGGTQLELTILSKDNRESKVVVTRNQNTLFRAKKLKWVPDIIGPPDEDFQFKSISPKVAYVALNTFGDSSIVTEFKKALPDIRKHQALIVDIRKNGGGNDDYALQIAEYLTDRSFIVGSMWKTRLHNAAKKAWAARGDTSLANYIHRNVWEKHPGDTTRIPASLAKLNMPVYILTSKRTGSAAEDFLIYLNYSSNVTRIGQSTAGSSGQPLEFKLPYGFTARICAKADEFPDGTPFINIGIKPQIEVKPAEGDPKDLELEKALAVIQDAKGK